MSKVIADVYEIKEKIGSGGGGVVYLGEHLRLNKQVVLKADKRKLSVGEDKLRREVDMLKSLSQTYIPQVYDFIEEDGVVYTVMDYIPGESLDYLIKRREFPEQREVLRWACQLLEALQYLHSRPPHGILHGDIKPANIMLRHDGNICLIDYNIALALGEDGAVSVGYSRGYASPEHYGSTDSGLGDTISESTEVIDEAGKNLDKTEVLDMTGNKAENGQNWMSSGKSTHYKVVQLDVRSDLYSLGATLYHLLSGKKPAASAVDVVPLGKENCSIAVAEIINKSMQAMPEKRYQSAQEMLQAFRNLKKNDIRFVSHKKRKRAVYATAAGIVFIGAGVTFLGQRQIRQVADARVLASDSEKKLQQGELETAVEKALQATSRKSELDAPVLPEAQKALTDALGVYDLKDGWKDYGVVELEEKPLKLRLSPEGTLFAVVHDFKLDIYKVASREQVAVLEMEKSALSDFLFINEEQILYAGKGGIALYDLSAQKEIWSGDPCTTICISGNRKKAAAVNRKDSKATIYHLSNGKVIGTCDFGKRHFDVLENDSFEDPQNNLLALDQNGDYLAVSDSTGGLIFYDLKNKSPEDLILYETSDYTKFQGGFVKDVFAYTAYGKGKSEFGAIDMKNIQFLASYESNNPLILKIKNDEVYLAEGNLLIKVDLKSGEQRELAKLKKGSIVGYGATDNGCLILAEDGTVHFFDNVANEIAQFTDEKVAFMADMNQEFAITADMNADVLRMFRKVSQKDTVFFEYDADFKHDEARIDEKNHTVLLFSGTGFRLYNMEGGLVQEAKLPKQDQIYDEQFIRGEKDNYLEVTWYDGSVKKYSTKDGALIGDDKIARPTKDLFETFETEEYTFEAPLHGKIDVYSKKGHSFVKTIDEDAFLTYVTELPEGFVMEYVTTDGARYGLYLNKDLAPIAYLDGLCDISEGNFIFDFYQGELRKVKIYTLDELIRLGRER